MKEEPSSGKATPRWTPCADQRPLYPTENLRPPQKSLTMKTSQRVKVQQRRSKTFLQSQAQTARQVSLCHPDKLTQTAKKVQPMIKCFKLFTFYVFNYVMMCLSRVSLRVSICVSRGCSWSLCCSPHFCDCHCSANWVENSSPERYLYAVPCIMKV